MQHTADVLIIGGGIIGASIAFHLRKRGVTVIVLERDKVGSHASRAAAGLLAPIRPLSEEDEFKSLLLLGIKKLASLVPELEDLSGIKVNFTRTGTLRLLPPEKVAATPAWVEAWRNKGYTIDMLTPEETCEREPLLAPGFAGAVSIKDEGQVAPALLTQSYELAARKLGALFSEHTEVVDIQRDEAGNRITGLRTAQGDYLACDHLVIAAGAWSAQMGERLGIEIPVRPVRGELIALRAPSLKENLHSILFDEGVVDIDFYAAPRPDGTVLLGATKAAVGYNTDVSAAGIQHLLNVATKLLPTLATWPIDRFWAGLRPKTSGSRPVLGPALPWRNVTVASGHSGFGITLSAVTGELISEAILSGRSPDLLRQFAPKMSGFMQPGDLQPGTSDALVPHHPAFSDEQVISFACQWTTNHFAVPKTNQARVRIRISSYEQMGRYWHCLVNYSPSEDDVLLSIVEQDQNLVVKKFVDYPPP